jgi:hypothetical protein
MDPQRITHVDLLRGLAVLETKVDRLIQDQAEGREAMAGEFGIYARLNRLEQRLAQVVILAAVCGLLLPVVTTVVLDRVWPAATVDVQTTIEP